MPPPAPEDPRPVYLFDGAHHASLILATEDGEMVRYAYGDWTYYARGKRNVLTGFAALAWPTRSALGRRRMPGPVSEDAIRRHVNFPFDAIHRIDVSRDRAEALRDRLDAMFSRPDAVTASSPLTDLTFVSHPDRYHALNNSNGAVARWLEQLGCRVSGPVFFSNWRIVDSPPSASAGQPRR